MLRLQIAALISLNLNLLFIITPFSSHFLSFHPMKNSFKQPSKSHINSSLSHWQNKQNTIDWFKGQKDITKILSRFNELIQTNNQAISSLRNEFTARATNGSLSKQDITQCFNDDEQPSYCQGPDNSMNQTYLTISKQPCTSQFTRSQLNEVNALNQKLELIQYQIQKMKRSDTQNSVDLEKRLSEKGQKTQIEKALNLSRLLVIEINQIQDRFKENEKTARIHEEKIKFLQQTINKMDQKFMSNKMDQGFMLNKMDQGFTPENKCRRKSTMQQKSFEDNIVSQSPLLNENLIKKLQTQIQQISKTNYTEIQQLKHKIQDNRYEKYQEQFNSIYSRIVNLQSHFDEIQTKTDAMFKETKLQILNLGKDMKKQALKSKKDTQLQLFKKFDSLDKLYTKKSYFLQEKQQTQTQIHKLQQNLNKSQQNLNKIHHQLNIRIDKYQKSLQSTQIMIQNHKSQLLFNLNKLTQQTSDKLIEIRQQIDKNLMKYAKTQTIKQYFSEQNQKVHQMINSNFQQQKQVNEVLCSENILGRWLWQNQQLKNGNLVAWDKEVINTLPQNFRFSLQRSSLIEICSGGIYKFELGFYSKKKPTIQILINGKVVMSAVNSSSYVIHHSSGKLKGIEPTEMSGLTLVDFFLIPEHSRIAIAYNGDVKGEGFMNIHRL